jgi:hypothetical protein
MSLLKRLVVGSFVLLASSPAVSRADGARRVWLEARPWTCARELPSLARDVELACDATRAGCDVARREEDATERVTLYCSDWGTWRIGLGVLDGADAVVATLEGDREERLRSAGMWVARFRPHGAPPAPEEPAPTPPPPPPAAPVVPPPVVVVPPPEVVVPPPAEILMVPAEPPAPPADMTPRPRPSRMSGRGGLSASIFDGVANSSVSGMIGGRVGVAFPLKRGFFLAPTGSFATLYDTGWPIPGSTPGNVVGREILVGADIGWGAPFDDLPVGFTLGLGGGGSWGNAANGGAVVATPGAGPTYYTSTNPNQWLTGYGRVAVTLQLPFRSWPIRPTATLSGTQVFGELGEAGQQAMLETGFAWQAF